MKRESEREERKKEEDKEDEEEEEEKNKVIKGLWSIRSYVFKLNF